MSVDSISKNRTTQKALAINGKNMEPYPLNLSGQFKLLLSGKMFLRNSETPALCVEACPVTHHNYTAIPVPCTY